MCHCLFFWENESWKSVTTLERKPRHFSKHASAVQTTMLTRRGLRFRVEWRCPCPNILYLKPNSSGETGNTIPRSECWLMFEVTVRSKWSETETWNRAGIGSKVILNLAIHNRTESKYRKPTLLRERVPFWPEMKLWEGLVFDTLRTDSTSALTCVFAGLDLTIWGKGTARNYW